MDKIILIFVYMTFSLTGFTQSSGFYDFKVKTLDKAGNEGKWSELRLFYYEKTQESKEQ